MQERKGESKKGYLQMWCGGNTGFFGGGKVGLCFIVTNFMNYLFLYAILDMELQRRRTVKRMGYVFIVCAELVLLSGCTEKIGEYWWPNHAIFLRTGEIVYSWNYTKVEFDSKATFGGSVEYKKLLVEQSSLRLMDTNGGGDREIFNRGGELKAASSNHVAVCLSPL